MFGAGLVSTLVMVWGPGSVAARGLLLKDRCDADGENVEVLTGR